MFKIWFSLLHKCRHPFFPIFQSKSLVKQPSLKLQTRFQTTIEAKINSFFCHHNHWQRIPSNFLSHFNSFFHQLLIRNSPRNESSTNSLFSPHHFPSQNQLHSPTFTNSFYESLGTSSTRNSTKLNLRLAKFSLLASKNDITHHHQLAAAS